MTVEQPTSTAEAAWLSRADLMALTKVRLSALVVVTTLFGYLVGSKGQGTFEWMRLLHTLIGTTLCAFGASVYNQILEMEQDARMDRTADRPLAARRMRPEFAFLLGWLFAGLGILHLLMKVNLAAASLAAATIAIYIFVYTPLKQRSSLNTLVGAVSGALPPLIGWAAAGRPWAGIEGLFLFGLLFFWQLPHFVAINWMYREQYVRGGFEMWSNDDEDGGRTGRLAFWFSVAMLLFMTLPFVAGFAGLWYLAGALPLTGLMVWLAWRFLRSRERRDARKLFFYTLIYLPLALGVVFLTWNQR